MKSPLAMANGGEGIDLRFIGYTSSGNTSLMAEPTPDKRMTNPDKIRADLAKKRAVQEEIAMLTPYCGQLESVVILGEAGEEPVFEASGASSAKKLITWLTDTYPGIGSAIKGDATDVPVHFLGFNAKTVLEVACKQVLMHNQTLKHPVRVPVRLWYNNGGLAYDVADCAISSSDRNVLSLESALEALNVSGDVAAMVEDPTLQATIARSLTQKLQLFGQWE